MEYYPYKSHLYKLNFLLSRSEERYRKLLANVKDGLVFSKDGDRIWQCRNCGHIDDDTRKSILKSKNIFITQTNLKKKEQEERAAARQKEQEERAAIFAEIEQIKANNATLIVKVLEKVKTLSRNSS